ncbi:unnamed protein product [marine sediment metagenome]|uniref:Uncharacterized protein n=1 Tax=marine sediment metagenome TaxID=412755 RepID=X1SEE4_9ZZZZ
MGAVARAWGRRAAFALARSRRRGDGQIALLETASGRLIKMMVTVDTHLRCENSYWLFAIQRSATLS